MSVRDLILGNSGSPYYFIGTQYYNGSSTDTNVGNYGQGTACDFSGNIYVLSTSTMNSSSVSGAVLTKFNQFGTQQWQKRLSYSAAYPNDTGNVNSIARIRISSNSGNIYTLTDDPNANESTVLTKFDSTGAITWQRTLDPGGVGSSHYLGDLYIDSSENIFVINCFYAYPSPATYFIYKINSSGTLLNCKEIYTVSGYTQPRSASITGDPSGNLYITTTGLNTGDIVLAKVNSSFTLQWQRNLATSASTVPGPYPVTYLNGYLYYAVTFFDSGTFRIILVSYDTSGTIQWQKKFNTSSYANPDYAIGLTSGNNSIYLCATSNASNYGVRWFAIDSSGTITLCRRITGSYAYSWGANVLADPTFGLYLTGFGRSATGVYGTVFANVPTDGSKTGTYSGGSLGTLTYTTDSDTLTTTSFTDSAAGATYLGGSFSIHSYSYSLSSNTFTNTFTPI